MFVPNPMLACAGESRGGAGRCEIDGNTQHPFGGATVGVRESSGTTRPVVSLLGIHKWFDDNHVLRGVDAVVERGQHVVVFGPSGSGNSMLLRTINLLEEPQKGSASILGVEYGPGIEGHLRRGQRGPACELRQRVGMVFQQFNLFPHLTALENVTIALRCVRNIARDEADERAALQLRRGRPRAQCAPIRRSSRAVSCSVSRSPVRW